MDPIFDRVVIVGAGLLGASLGLALQASGASRRVIGVGRRQSSLDKALAAGAVHETSLDLAQAVSDADLIVIATPASTVISTLDIVREACSAQAIVVDVASTKATICAHAAAHWDRPRRFIGCHPMAGSEKSGPEHATASLYENTVCLIEDSPDLDPGAAAQVRQLWERVGARVVAVDAESHDRILACTSHVPHILASTLALLAAHQNATCDFVGNGFRDMTRVAAGSPEMWRDITLTNREAITDGLEAMKELIDTFLVAMEAKDDQALSTLFEAGQISREKVLAE
ncbi:MAG: prephenate dehydrogenase/arogenate dehydrogenase family protein [Candidatus Hydrogenedentes bacterium]|nr:prephenate dehydrogenase/arogenate dehydrogenase family protein [Candidatus Hydrogenedentota bacterium]